MLCQVWISSLFQSGEGVPKEIAIPSSFQHLTAPGPSGDGAALMPGRALSFCPECTFQMFLTLAHKQETGHYSICQCYFTTKETKSQSHQLLVFYFLW